MQLKNQGKIYFIDRIVEDNNFICILFVLSYQVIFGFCSKYVYCNFCDLSNPYFFSTSLETYFPH